MRMQGNSMGEWVEVSEFPEYEVHPKHGVRRKNGKVLKGRNWIGYPKITLMKDGVKHEKRIHKIVAEHFLPNPDGKPIVNHKDANRSNYSVDNLEWVDNSENQLHRWRTQKEGLKKMKYEKEYGLKKIAKLGVKLRSTFGGDVDIGSLPMSERIRIERIAKAKGPGYRGKIETKVNGAPREMFIEVNDSDRIVPKKVINNIETNSNPKDMLYKETLKKKAGAVGRILTSRAAKNVVKSKPTRNLGILSEKGPSIFSPKKVAAGIGLGATAAGLAAVASN